MEDYELELARKAIEATKESLLTYVKSLSANDSGETGGHQSGVLVSIKACRIAFGGDNPPVEHIAKRSVQVTWQDEVTLPNARWTWYASKRELRLTCLTPAGSRRSVLNESMTGALFVLAQVASDAYRAYVLNTDDEIEEYLTAHGLGVQDTNILFAPRERIETTESAEAAAIRAYVLGLSVGFDANWPQTAEVSREAQTIQNETNGMAALRVTNPDQQVVAYARIEYAIFRELEGQAYGPVISGGFGSVEDFVAVANTVLNRRKSRAGKSLENHLASLFRANRLPFSAQKETEGKKKPDFIFPSIKAYQDHDYPTSRLVVLAAKTTCKDRWRQILSEAARTRNGEKYLMTMQQGITTAQLQEMRDERVQLIVPRPYIAYYPPEFRQSIWTLKHFIEFTRQRLT